MATNTAQAVEIANKRIRPTADRLAQTYNYCIIMLKLAAADNWPALFDAFNPKDPLPDGSADDGRNPITPETIKALLVTMQQFVDFVEQGNTLNLILSAAVNPERL